MDIRDWAIWAGAYSAAFVALSGGIGPDGLYHPPTHRLPTGPRAEIAAAIADAALEGYKTRTPRTE